MGCNPNGSSVYCMRVHIKTDDDLRSHPRAFDRIKLGHSSSVSRRRTALLSSPGIGDGSVPSGALNARDFGAVGNGITDDSEALQRAIDAAQAQHRQLILPNGNYTINTGLSVASTRPQGNPPVSLGPLGLIGQGRDLSIITAVRPMNAVINFSAVIPEPTDGHTLSNLLIDAAHQANYSVRAPAITRSYFLSVGVISSRLAGLSLGYGWCNRVELCEVRYNHIGLHTYNMANNIDIVDNIFEDNTGIGMYLGTGEQMRIEGNVVEGHGGPGIMVVASPGLVIQGNYFEVNNDAHVFCCRINCCGVACCQNHSNMVLVPEPVCSSCKSDKPSILSSSDIVLNGVSNSDPQPGDVWYYGATYLSRSVSISGNFHSGNEGGQLHPFSAVLAVSVHYLVLSGNTCGMGHHHSCGNSALVETGTDHALWDVQDVSITANSGWFFSTLPPLDVPAPYLPDQFNNASRFSNGGLVKLSDSTSSLSSQTNSQNLRFNSWFISDSPALHPRRNLASGGLCVAPGTSQLIDLAEQLDGTTIHRLQCNTSASSGKCSASVATVYSRCDQARQHENVGVIDLSTAPSIAGQSIYVAVQARLNHNGSSLQLSIDHSDDRRRFEHPNAGTVNEAIGRWGMYTFQATLPWVGMVRLGVDLIQLPQSGQSGSSKLLDVDIAGIVVAPVGTEWGRVLKTDDDASTGKKSD